LKKLDAMAGLPKMLFAFSTPITSAASETSRMKGNMICVSSAVRFALTRSKPGASTATSWRENTMPSTHSAPSTSTVKRRHLVGEPPSRLITLAGDGLREGGDEGGGQRALGEQVAQQVRDAEGHREGVHRGAAAEQCGADLLAGQPQHPAAHDCEPDHARGLGVQPFGAGIGSDDFVGDQRGVRMLGRAGP
jgi:hypothetical protein